MTFLELVEALCDECGVPTDELDTVEGDIENDQLRRMIRWTARSWYSIQAAKATWKFMRRTATWVSIASQGNYTPAQCGVAAGSFRTWKPHSFRNYLTASGVSSEIHMPFRNYPDFRDLWLFGANRNVESRPVEMTIHPDNSIYMAPKPPAGYTFIGDYYRAAVLMTEDDEVAAVPDGHDPLIIVHKARMRYGAFYGAKEQYAEGQELYRGMMRKLLNDQLDDEVQLGGTIA